MVLDSAKKWWNGEKEEEKSGWGISGKLGAAASTVKDYSWSAASTVGSSAKSAWNSEAAASTSSAARSAASYVGNTAKTLYTDHSGKVASTVKDYSVSAASTVGSTAKAAWNSEVVSSTSSAISSGLSSAGSGIKSWWKGSSDSKQQETYEIPRWDEKPITVQNAIYVPRNKWIVDKEKNMVDSAKKGWNGEKEDDKNGWGITGKLGTAASAVKDYSYSAASTVGNSAKAVWNSDAVASTSSTIKDYSVSAASSVGSSAKAVWNSEAVSSTSSAISSGLSSTGSGIKNWWNGSSSSSKEEEVIENSGDGYRGGIAAIGKNASKYVVQTIGRSSNILNIFDKTNRSSLGNPKWWIRFDRPHGNVGYHHININKAVTGLKDPHIQISPTTAKAVGVFGKVAEKANDYAPILTTAAMIYESYRIGKDVKKDYDHGTTRNTIMTVATTGATYTSGSIGAYAGGLLGSSIFPGIGTIFGGIVGGVVGGYYGGYYSHAASEKALDHVEWDVITLECNGCREEYTWKKYQEIEGVCCTPFNNKKQDLVEYWYRKFQSNHDF